MATADEQKEALRKFTLWFREPYQLIKNNGKGHEAFVVLSIGLFLCERYYRSKRETDTIDKPWSKIFLVKAAAFCNTDHGFFSDFWDIYRNGMQHQGTPKHTTDYDWNIHGDYPGVPCLADVKGRKIICIDPYKFTESLLALWESSPDVLAEYSSHQLGDTSTTALPYVLMPPARPAP